MKYFAKFIVLSLCITVLTGYEALAQQDTSSASQTDNQEVSMDRLYEDTKSFSTLVDESDNSQCRIQVEDSFVHTNLIVFYGARAWVDQLYSQLRRNGFINPGLVRTPALDIAENYLDNVISETSSGDIEFMRGELESLEGEWNSCVENNQ